VLEGREGRAPAGPTNLAPVLRTLYALVDLTDRFTSTAGGFRGDGRLYLPTFLAFFRVARGLEAPTWSIFMGSGYFRRRTDRLARKFSGALRKQNE